MLHRDVPVGCPERLLLVRASSRYDDEVPPIGPQVQIRFLGDPQHVENRLVDDDAVATTDPCEALRHKCYYDIMIPWCP